MKVMMFAFIIAVACAQEMLITKEYVDYLKRHVGWEVMDYEENIFKDWTVEEAKIILGETLPGELKDLPSVEVDRSLPSSIDWRGADCDHGIRNQGSGSPASLVAASMLSTKCCLNSRDHGFLSVQEILSCAKPTPHWPSMALNYVIFANGLVPEACFPSRGMVVACPKACVDGKDWQSSHVCNCVGGYKLCDSTDKMKASLKTGPITAAFGACRSFFNYRSGIYKCDCGGAYIGIHMVVIMGYADAPECHWHAKNSWGTNWGMKGYFDIGCDECGINGAYSNGNTMCEKVFP